jgi:hypothetical protein
LDLFCACTIAEELFDNVSDPVELDNALTPAAGKPVRGAVRSQLPVAVEELSLEHTKVEFPVVGVPDRATHHAVGVAAPAGAI